MLSRATELGHVASVTTLEEHVKSLTSMRDFPLFDGDFFEYTLPEVLMIQRNPTDTRTRQSSASSAAESSSAAGAPPTDSEGGALLMPPMAAHQPSEAVIKQVQTEVRKQRKDFLVATLVNPPPAATASSSSSTIPTGGTASTSGGAGGGTSADEDDDDGVALSNKLFDSRSVLMNAMADFHWQWDEPRRAKYSTMMMLAHLGGPPAP